MTLRCPALDSRGRFPARFARAGVPGAKNLSPPLQWDELPADGSSFVITIIDRHPVANNWLHWCVTDIPGTVRELAEGASKNAQLMPSGATELLNTFGDPGYGGPQPPPGTGPHEYVMTLYALSLPTLKLGARASLSDVRRQMKGNILGSAEVVGIFER